MFNNIVLRRYLMSVDEELEMIKDRNRRVEANKAWETSKTRAVLVALITYFVMILVMHALKVENPFISAIIPTLGFLLSTLSVNSVKNFWMAHIYKGNKSCGK